METHHVLVIRVHNMKKETIIKMTIVSKPIKRETTTRVYEWFWKDGNLDQTESHTRENEGFLRSPKRYIYIFFLSFSFSDPAAEIPDCWTRNTRRLPYGRDTVGNPDD